MTPRVSIIIRCFNEGKHIGRLLEGITKQTVKEVQVVIVDSGSTDETHDVLQGFEHDLVYIAPEDFSFGRALNVGIEAARAPFFVAVSAHCYPVRVDWLESLLAPFEDSNVALTYGSQRGPPGCHFSEQMIFHQWFPDGEPVEQGHPFCNNANAAVRRRVWETLPYDEELTGLEDLAWAKEAIRRGHTIQYVPPAQVVHVHNETSKQTYRRYYREALAMQRIYPEHRFGWFDLVRLFPASVVRDFVSAIKSGLFLRNVTDIVRFRWLQMWGTYRGSTRKDPVTPAVRQRFYYPGVSRHGPREDEPALIDYEN